MNEAEEVQVQHHRLFLFRHFDDVDWSVIEIATVFLRAVPHFSRAKYHKSRPALTLYYDFFGMSYLHFNQLCECK